MGILSDEIHKHLVACEVWGFQIRDFSDTLAVIVQESSDLPVKLSERITIAGHHGYPRIFAQTTSYFCKVTPARVL